MHFEKGRIPQGYIRYTGRKQACLLSGAVLAGVLFILSIATGPVRVPLDEVLKTIFFGGGSDRWRIIIFNIRLPQSTAAVVCGAGLAVAGAVMQTILRNPLGSPFTLGISNAAAFGAALAVITVGTGVMRSTGADVLTVTNPYITTVSAFVFSLGASFVILLISRVKKASPEVMVLAGVTLGSLFTAGTMLLQYFSDDVQLAAMVFWTFGDLSRAGWRETGVISLVVLPVFVYFYINRWNYNAMNGGDETAKGLGVSVERVRLLGMTAASLVTAVIISFTGIISFVGLVCPHIIRRLTGDDHRFLLPGSVIAGAVLLLGADTAARTVLAPSVLPVAVLTSFLGAPVFMWLLVRGYRQ